MSERISADLEEASEIEPATVTVFVACPKGVPHNATTFLINKFD